MLCLPELILAPQGLVKNLGLERGKSCSSSGSLGRLTHTNVSLGGYKTIGVNSLWGFQKKRASSLKALQIVFEHVMEKMPGWDH